MEPRQEPSSPPPPHVLIYPFPAQGHVNSMLKLAELLALAGLRVTFLNTEHNQDRLVRYTDVASRFSRYAGFQFKTVPDGLQEEHPRSGGRFMEMFDAMGRTTRSLLKELLVGSRPRVDCIIGDGIMGFDVLGIADELGIPVIRFRTISACCFWVYFCIPDMIAAGELPIKGSEDMDRQITTVLGMEAFIRCRDLPSFCRVDDMEDPHLQLVATQTRGNPQASALILNTFEDLEGPILSHIRSKFPKVYAIGPLHEHLSVRISNSKMRSSPSSNSLWEVDRSCIAWLDDQPLESVVYVSFGSIAVLTREQLLEFWYGLVNSKKRFLWVLRPDSIAGEEGNTPVELVQGTKERGYLVGWAPQEEVLAHRAIGGFLTHSGWNSTLESVVAGVPMICWPYFADQQVNSRFVSEVWKLGLDMKDTCDRRVVEKMMNDLMVERREEFVKSSERMAKLAKQSISENGSSCSNLDCLIEDIRLMRLQRHD